MLYVFVAPSLFFFSGLKFCRTKKARRSTLWPSCDYGGVIPLVSTPLIEQCFEKTTDQTIAEFVTCNRVPFGGCVQSC